MGWVPSFYRPLLSTWLQAPDPALDHLLQLPPHERVAAVKPFWRSLEEAKQLELLSLDVNELKEAAKSLADAAKQHAGRERALGACIMGALRSASACMPVTAMFWHEAHEGCHAARACDPLRGAAVVARWHLPSQALQTTCRRSPSCMWPQAQVPLERSPLPHARPSASMHAGAARLPLLPCPPPSHTWRAAWPGLQRLGRVRRTRTSRSSAGWRARWRRRWRAWPRAARGRCGAATSTAPSTTTPRTTGAMWW